MRTRLAAFWLVAGFLILAFGVVLLTATDYEPLAVAQSEEDRRKAKRSPEKNYGFTEAAPPGDWSAQSEIDITQSRDSAVPVVIAGLTSYAGKGKWGKHVMIESVVLKNRAEKTVSGSIWLDHYP